MANTEYSHRSNGINMSLRYKYITKDKEADPALLYHETRYLIKCLNSEDDHTGVSIYNSKWIPRMDTTLDILGYTTKWDPLGWEIKRSTD